ncbi:MAG: glycosyltransferase, partial [Planctomycetota bacterium]
MDVGGLETLLVDFARQARPRHLEATIFCLGQPGQISSQIEQTGCATEYFNVADGFRPSLWPRLVRRFRRGRFDAIHTHDIRPLIYAAPAARWAGVPIRVHTQHGRALGQTPRQRKIVNWASRSVTDWISVSRDINDMLHDAGVRPQRQQVITNGVDGRKFGRPQFASQSTTLLQPNTLPQPNASNFGGPVDTPNHAKSVLCVARLS